MALVVADIAQVRRQIASLSNSASWLSLTTASITSGAATLTFTGNETPFVSTAVDAGKQVVIRGAGASGADLYTTISAVTNTTTATTVANAGTTVANALCAFGGDTDDDRHSIQEIDECMFEADEQIVLAILESLNHWARADYLVLSASIVHAAQLPSHVGLPAEILISNASGEAYLPGTWADLKAIQRYRANSGTAPNNVYGSTASTAAASPLAGYYNLDPDNYLFYTGFDAKARLLQFTRSLTALQSPNVYQGTAIAGGLRLLEIKDGDDPVNSSAWAKFWLDGLASVRMGVMQSIQAA